MKPMGRRERSSNIPFPLTLLVLGGIQELRKMRTEAKCNERLEGRKKL